MKVRSTSDGRLSAQALALALMPIGCSCQNDSTQETVADGSSGGSAGSGGAATGGSAGSTTTGGASGALGTSGTGNDAGTLRWAATGSTIFGCPLEHLVPPYPSLFEWAPCAGASSCESATWNDAIIVRPLGKDSGVGSASTDDDGAEVRFAFVMVSAGKQIGVVAAENGDVLKGLRLSGECRLQNATLRADGFTFMVSKSVTDTTVGAVLGSLSGTAFRVANPPAQPNKVPQWQTQNQERVAWWWAPGDQLSSFSAIDGSDFRFFASASYNGPIVALRAPIGFPTGFLYEAVLAKEGGSAQRTLFISDGLDAGRVLVTPEGTFDYGQAEYLHSHIAWLRGTNPSSLNAYDSVELWAAPWSSNALAGATRVGVVETPVAGTAYQAMPPETGGGFGHYLLPWGDGETYGRIDVWSVANGSSKRFSLPSDTPALAPSGVSRRHVYVNARKPDGPGYATHFYRFAFD